MITNYFKRFILFIALLLTFAATAQIDYGEPCDAITPTFTLDLTGVPDSVWTTETQPDSLLNHPQGINREGLCCDQTTHTTPPDRCVEFWFTLDPGAVGIRFSILSGAEPRGALGYQINCDTEYPVDDVICLSGPGPHRLTFCKPGNNPNHYAIESIPGPTISPPFVVSDGCNGDIYTSGYDPSTITWTSLSGGVNDMDYVSCMLTGADDVTGCENLNVNYGLGAPDSITYQVSGWPIGSCSPDPVLQEVTVYFVNDKLVEILPQDPTICFGGTGVDLTANASGGRPPYSYLWSTGQTTQIITANLEGTYWVLVSDATSCPDAGDTVVVTAFLNPITADPGGPYTSCFNNPSIQLNGTVTGTTTGEWYGGQGTYIASTSTLDAFYIPNADELAAGTVTHCLRTTNNGSCPGDSACTIHTILPSPEATIEANTDCNALDEVELIGHIQNADGGIWTSDGDGTFTSTTDTITTYIASGNDIANGSVVVTLTTTGNGLCNESVATVTLNFADPATVDAGADIFDCSNVLTVGLTSTFTNSTGVVWTSINGSGNFSSIFDQNPDYTLNTADQLLDTISFVVTSTGGSNPACPAIDTVNLVLQEMPIISAGENEICATTTSVDFSGNVQNATGGTWSTLGDGTFSPVNSLNTTYTTGTSDIANGNVFLVIESTGNGFCPAALDTIELVIAPTPTADAGGDLDICYSAANVSLSGSVTLVSNGTWTAVNGTGPVISLPPTSANYILSSGDRTLDSLVFVFESDGTALCPGVIDTLLVYIEPEVALVPANNTVCSNQTPVSLDVTSTNATSHQWSTGGDGTFNPDVNTLDATYSPGGTDIINGTVTLTICNTDNVQCPQVCENLTLNITPEPDLNAGGDLEICRSETVVSLTGQLFNATDAVWGVLIGNGTFTSSNTPNTDYNLDPGDLLLDSIYLTYSLTNVAPCPEKADTILLALSDPPTYSLASTIVICPEDDSIPLSSALSNYESVQWSTSTGSTNFTPSRDSANTTFILGGTESAVSSFYIYLDGIALGGCGIIRDSIEVLKNNPLPSAIARDDTTVCPTVPSIPLYGTVNDALVSVWTSRGGGGFNPSDSITTVTSGLLPSIDYTPTTVDRILGYAGVELCVYPSLGCSPVCDSMYILFSEPFISVDAGPDDTVCVAGQPVDLNASVTGGGSVTWSTSGDGTFIPDNTSIDAQYIPSDNDILGGTVVFTVQTFSLCSPQFDSKAMRIVPTPEVDAGTDLSICLEGTSVAFSADFANAGGVLWSSTGTGNITPTTTDPTVYYEMTAADIASANVQVIVETTGNGDCPGDMDTVDVIVLPTPSIDLDDDVICEGADVTLTAEFGATYSYLWETLGGTDLPFVSNVATLTSLFLDTTVSVIVTDTSGCFDYDFSTISVIEPPMVEVGDQSACVGQTVVLNAQPTNVTDTTIGTYVWTHNLSPLSETTSSISVTDAGEYQVIFYTGSCNGGDTATVTLSLPPDNTVQTGLVFCAESDGDLTLDAGAGYLEYVWSTGDSTRTITVSTGGSFEVSVYSGDNCFDTDVIDVEESCPPIIVIPNGFTPNGDGDNEWFTIYNHNINTYDLRIYNRWGEVIFQSLDPNVFWDGTYRDEKMPIGTYPWTLIYSGFGVYDTKVEKHGKVSVVR